ncbi:hypothetical protein G6F42_023752 [Rhizopus arrhizus]|nr:hypothetical protein G6F42_023752 [Rhizopus arrhizus]
MKAYEEEQIEDLESILKYGTEALFDNDDSKDIRYDDAAIDNLLNREQYREAATELQIKEVEELEGREKDEGALSFSYAKVWQADGTTEELEVTEKNDENESDFWEKFLIEQQAQKEKKKQEKREAELKLGRGGRKRTTVSYVESSHSKAIAAAKKDQVGKDDEFVLHEEESDDEFEGHRAQEPDLLNGMMPLKKQKIDDSSAQKKKGKSPIQFVSVTPVKQAKPGPAPPPKPVQLRPILTEWEWIIPAGYQHLLWNTVVLPGILDIVVKYQNEHQTVASAPTPHYGHLKAVILSEIWKRVHEYSKREMDREFVTEVNSGLNQKLATERFHLKFAFFNENINRTLHQVIQGYINFYENEVHYQIRRAEVDKQTYDLKMKMDQLRAIDSQHEYAL